MTIELSRTMEAELRNLAEQEGRELNQVVEDALRQYIEAAAINDVDSGDVARTQMALVPDLPAGDDWTEQHS